MLIEFRVENHRSLKTEQVLTMEAGRVDGDATIPRTVPGYSKPLLPVAALYGANASGKSNVLSAIQYMQQAVTNSHRTWEPNGGVPRDPFAWGECRIAPSMYEAMFVDHGVRYRYGFVVSDERIEEEWLHAWPKGKQQTWFEREGQKFTFGDNLKGERRLIQDVTRPNSLFLSTAAQHQHSQLEWVAKWFTYVQALGVENETITMWMKVTWKMMEAMRDSTSTDETIHTDVASFLLFQSEMKRFINMADVGIQDVKLQESPSGKLTDSVFLLRHESTSDQSWLPLDRESKGTKTLFHFALPYWQSLRTGGVLLVDELEASLHPKLAIEIVKQFNNPQTNPKNAQVIFTTHDTNLLGNDVGEPVLRRDQVWLTKKDKEGATVLYPLTDFKPRKPENLERGYLQGRYGAIPYLGNFSLLGEGAT